MDRLSRQKSIKETQGLNDTLGQIDLIDIYRTIHSKAAEYTFFSSAHGTVSRIDLILDHRLSLRKFKNFEIVLSILCNHNTMKLEINHGKKIVKYPHTWRLNILLNNHWITEEMKKEIKQYLETNYKETTTVQNLQNAAKTVLREKFLAI